MIPEDAEKTARQLQFLFAAFSVVWLITLGFLFNLSRRLARVFKEIEDLKKKS